MCPTVVIIMIMMYFPNRMRILAWSISRMKTEEVYTTLS